MAAHRPKSAAPGGVVGDTVLRAAPNDVGQAWAGTGLAGGGCHRRWQRVEGARHGTPALTQFPVMGGILPCIVLVPLDPSAIELFFTHP